MRSGLRCGLPPIGDRPTRALGVARRSVGVVAGHTGRDKIVVVEGLDEVVARERLEALLPAVPGEDLGGSLP